MSNASPLVIPSVYTSTKSTKRPELAIKLGIFPPQLLVSLAAMKYIAGLFVLHGYMCCKDAIGHVVTNALNATSIDDSEGYARHVTKPSPTVPNNGKLGLTSWTAKRMKSTVVASKTDHRTQAKVKRKDAI